MIAGIDTHKDTLALAVLDAAGRVRHQQAVSNTEVGFDEVEQLLADLQVTKVGIEGSGNYGRGIALRLVLAGAVKVVEVPPSLTSRERSARPGKGKTDPSDAVAIARVTGREPDLPPVRLAVGAAADLRALVDYRTQLVHERTALGNRVHAELHGLRPGYQRSCPRLTGVRDLARARALIADDKSVRAELTRRRLDRLDALLAEIKELRALVADTVKKSGTTLSELYGVGPLIAASIIGEVVDIRRYPNRHAFAAANGSAPLPASSGRTSRHRLNRCGNRRLNKALYTIAITQIRADTEGRAYYQRKRAEGKTGREALRCLKRRLSDLIYRTLLNELQVEPVATQGARVTNHDHQPLRLPGTTAA